MSAQDVAKSAVFAPNQVREVNSAIERLTTLRSAGAVKRLHTVPVLVQHTIAEHVYGSLLVASELVTLNRRSAANQCLALSRELVFTALLLHDAPEVSTGDIPAPVKRREPKLQAVVGQMEAEFYQRVKVALPSLNSMEEDIVKASDTLDLGFCCLREREMGNRHPTMQLVFNNVLDYTTAQEYLVGVVELKGELLRCWEALS